MDHTLVRYHSRAFEQTTHEMVLKKLQERNYPGAIAQLPFDYDLAIRGLVIDKFKGNLLKVSRHGAIRGAFHGTRAMDFASQKANYSSTYIDLRDTRYTSIDTAFSISTANLFMQLVDLKDRSAQFNLPDYATMSSDLMRAVDDCHRDGSLKGIVRENLSKYIVKDEAVVQGLERFKKHDKKLFVLTNSEFNYTKLLLDYAINPFLREHKHWQDLFEIVITSAQKPRFFFDDLKFLKVNPADGTMTNLEEPLKKGVFQGGCAGTFTRDLGLEGDDILYIGDHIYGDILRLKKDCNWRTAMVVEDLEAEIEKYRDVVPIQKEIDQLMNEKDPLEREHVELVCKKIESGDATRDTHIQDLQNMISAKDKLIAERIRAYQSHFNKYWGEVMRAGNEESYFAHQTERFACIYMAKLSDLLQQPPRTYFRAPRRPLAHEMQTTGFLADPSGH